jgi:hypothetical protein
MSYRVRLHIDMSFENESDAIALSEVVLPFLQKAKELSPLALNIKEGQPNEEIGYYTVELCGHVEGKPCKITDSFTVSKKVE